MFEGFVCVHVNLKKPHNDDGSFFMPFQYLLSQRLPIMIPAVPVASVSTCLLITRLRPPNHFTLVPITITVFVMPVF